MIIPADQKDFKMFATLYVVAHSTDFLKVINLCMDNKSKT